MSFETHNLSVIDIAKYVETQKKELDKLYGDKIVELCKNNPTTQVYNNINEIYQSVYGEHNMTNYNDGTNIKWWFDMNHNKFIEPINNYQGKIFKTYNFKLYGHDFFLHNDNVYKKTNIPQRKILLQKNNNSGCGCLQSKKIDVQNNSNLVSCGCGNYINYYVVNTESSSPTATLTLMTDDHLNIIIPQYGLIIIKNYTPFTLGSLDNIFDIEENKIYNLSNTNDAELYNKIKNFMSCMNTNSADCRNGLNTDIFDKIFEFIDYDDKMKQVKNKIKYIDLLMTQGNTKPLLDEIQQYKKELEILTNENKIKNDLETKVNQLQEELDKYNDITLPEMTLEQMKCKIKSLEKINKTLEMDMLKYKSEVNIYREHYDNRNKEILSLQQINIDLTETIAKNHLDKIQMTKTISDMSNIQIMYETLNKQIKEFNESREKENLQYQFKILELTESINKLTLENTLFKNKISSFDNVSVEIENLISVNKQLSDKFEKSEENVNKIQLEKQSIISKSILLNDKINMLNEDINKYMEKIKLFESDILSLNKKNSILEAIISEKDTEFNLIKNNKISELKQVGEKGDYESILYQQIKDMESDIEKMRKLIKDKDLEIKTEKEKYNAFEDKIKSLIWK